MQRLREIGHGLSSKLGGLIDNRHNNLSRFYKLGEIKVIGQNRYLATLTRFGIQNLNEQSLNEIIDNISIIQPQNPCIFLSHKSDDKAAVQNIAEYIQVEKKIDVYFDINDAALQKAVKDDDHTLITKFIEVGIQSSTHLMTFISEKTKNSWWVPYEVGFAKRSNKNLSTLELKDAYAPPFLKITRILKNTKDLDEYLDEINNRHIAHRRATTLLYEHNSQSNHALSAFLRT